MHKSKFTYLKTVSFIIIFLGCLVLCSGGRLCQRRRTCTGDEKEGFETSAEAQTVLQTALQKWVASYGMSCRPDFLHLKRNHLGAKTSMQERKGGGRKSIKCVLMLMSFCRSYVNNNLLTTVFLAPPYQWFPFHINDWNEMGRKCNHADILALRLILTILISKRRAQAFSVLKCNL